MRRSRWLILAAIIAIVIFVRAAFLEKRSQVSATPAPKPLESGIDGRANDWVYTQSDADHPRVTIRAKRFRQVEAPSIMELEGVELELFKKDGLHFDLVKSATAQFDISAKTLFAPGAVEIAMGEPVEGQPPGRVVSIHTTGVHFASDTGKASTDNTAAFQFDLGHGSARGVDYDPTTRELHLRSQVVLDWTGKPSANSKPMHVEAGEAYYHESQSKVVLQPWSKLTRDALHMEAGTSLISLDQGTITEVDTQMAKGVQEQEGRKVEFAADHMVLSFGDDMLIQNIKGERNGKLISTAATMRTTVTADTLNMEFAREGGEAPTAESVLTNAVASGKSTAEALPIPRAGELPAETRILRSEVIRMKMQMGGKEIENVETDGPGTVDFLPNRPEQPKRTMKGDRIWIAYGSENRIQSFRSVNATTRTDKPAGPPMFTSSKEILAQFDPKTSELAKLEQKTDFHYEEGARRATADKATLEEAKNLIVLEGKARSWDPTGSAAADRITMNQQNGDVLAEGHVATTHVPEQKPSAGSSAVLSTTDVMQGRAQKMTSAEKNQKLHYEGNAVVWQGANRVEADRIDIDRAKQMLEARGKVVSQFADKPKAGDSKTDEPTKAATAKAIAPAAPIFTVVRAPELIYTGDTRIAHYKGGVHMTRPDLNVTGKEMQAFLNESGAENSLNKALADGGVKIVSSAQKRMRTGTSEHSEYFAQEQKVILSQGEPLLIDSLKGQTRGSQLTWWANNDRLLVNGVESRPADSLLRKK